MANSILFDGLVNTFDDVKDLEEWAIEYGHSHELVVQERITFLRNQSISESMDVDIGLNSDKPDEVSTIYIYIYIYLYLRLL